MIAIVRLELLKHLKDISEPEIVKISGYVGSAVFSKIPTKKRTFFEHIKAMVGLSDCWNGGANK